MNEIWKDIPQYEPYQASSLGNIRIKLNDGTYKQVKPFLNMDGYYQVELKGCPTRLPNLHRLIAFAFHGVPQDKSLIVDHLNNIHTDNRPENLEWISRAENYRRAVALGRKPRSKTQVKCIETGEIFESIKDCSIKTGIRLETLRYTTFEGLEVKGQHYVRISE